MVRQGETTTLNVAMTADRYQGLQVCAMVDHLARNATDYSEHKIGMQRIAMDAARSVGSCHLTVFVNVLTTNRQTSDISR